MSTTQELRQIFTDKPELVADFAPGVADNVRKKLCNCCGQEPDEQMECGHYRCILCTDFAHGCVACALAS